MSYKVEVIADDSGVWASNQLRFATEREGSDYALDLMMRWTAVTQWRVVESKGRQPMGSKPAVGHTPGPWPDAPAHLNAHDADIWIMGFQAAMDWSAAPEMFEARKDAAQYLGYSVPDDHPVMAKVDAAIAKAEGRNP